MTDCTARKILGKTSLFTRMQWPLCVAVFIPFLICCNLSGTERKDHDREVAILPLRAITHEEAQDVLGEFLSEDGRLSYVASRHALVVIDYPSNIRTLRMVLSKIDGPPVNIRVSVMFGEASDREQDGLGVTWGGLTVTRTKGGKTVTRGSANVTAENSRTAVTSQSTQFIITRNNRPARIWAGETVLEPVWIYEYGLRHGWWHKELVEQNFGASLWVLPRLIGENSVQVEVYPRITARGDTRLSVDARELSTEVVIQNGQVVSLGGLDQETQTFYRHLIGTGRVFNGQHLTIRIRADIMRSADE